MTQPVGGHAGRWPCAPVAGTELGLIILVVVIIGATYALAAFGQNAEIPANIGPFLGIVLGLCWSPPIWPPGAGPPTPTRRCCRSPRCSTASATSSSPA